MGLHTLPELTALPTIWSSHFDDLKIEEVNHGGERRVWLSRMTVADGAPYDNQVTVERKQDDGSWRTIVRYEATAPRAEEGEPCIT